MRAFPTSTRIAVIASGVLSLLCGGHYAGLKAASTGKIRNKVSLDDKKQH